MQKEDKRLLKTFILNGTFIICSNILLIVPSTSYSYASQWEKTYGGSTYDFGYSVQQTMDGGYIIAGYTGSYGAGENDVYLIKTDIFGKEVWGKTFGGNSGDYGRSVQQTTDGGYIIAGHTGSFGAGGSDIYLIKTDAAGNKLWSKTYGGPTEDIGYSVQQTKDGGYIIAGYQWQDSGWNTYLIKTNAWGNKLWSKTFAKAGSADYGSSVQQTADGGYIIAGSAQAINYWDDVYLLKTDSLGNELWSKTFGGDYGDHGSSVIQTVDGGYIIVGNTDSQNYPWHDVYVIKTDKQGNKLWSKIFGGIYDDYGHSVQQTDDGGYIFTGQTDSYDIGEGGIYLVKTDANGTEIWHKTFGEVKTIFGHSVQQVEDGGYVIAGSDYRDTKSYDVCLIYFNPKIVDIFGFEIGNSWRYEGLYLGNPYLLEREITSLNTSLFPVPTYAFEIKEDGILTGTEWYENAGNEIKLWGTTIYEEGLYYTANFSQGLSVEWFPMEVGDQRYSSATVNVLGVSLNVSMTADVVNKSYVTLSFSKLEAYEIQYQMRIWGKDPSGNDLEFIDSFTWWVVPYLGAVKDQGADFLVKLTSFAIGGGMIKEESDADNDWLKDYLEILTYGTDWQNFDTEYDGMPDGWEINYGLNPLVNDANYDNDNDGFTNLVEYQKGYDPIDPKSHPVASIPWLLLLLE